MSRTGNEARTEHDPAGEQQEIAEVQAELDERAEGGGLAAEAGAAEDNGISEG